MRPWQRLANAWTFAVGGCLALAALSVLAVQPAPAYDPWSWLLWGREVAGGTLNTAEGPAFKPLPVAICAAVSLLGDAAAPVVWVLLARAAAFAAIALAFLVARRLGGAPAGLLAAAGVAFCGAFPLYAASGDVTGLFLALVLAGVLAWWSGRRGVAAACVVACCLLRVEAWPFALALAILAWRRRPDTSALSPDLRGNAGVAWIAPVLVLVPAAWFVPEWLGSGDLLRSGGRARIPNPGQPAEAGVPFLASLGDAVTLPLLPLLLAAATFAVARDRRAAPLAAAGAAWVALVAVMAQAGFSGEARYALPGAALVAVAGAVAVAGLPRAFLVAAALVVAAAAVPRVLDLADVRDHQAHKWRLARDLEAAIDLVGRDTVLRCGTPFVGAYRGPLLAYHLDVAKEDVEPDATPRPPGVVFRSRLLPGSPVAPAADGFQPLYGVGSWDLHARCR